CEPAARSWFAGNATRGGAVEPQLVWTGNYDATRGPLAVPFYVFNIPGGGWIAISGDDSARPVLARSQEGSFSPNDLPDIVSEWFDGYADQIYFLRSQSSGNETAKAQWESLLSGESTTRATAVKMLGTVLWGQGVPFRNMCFKIDGALPPCGCTNTAGCEVMYYYKHPYGRDLPIPGYTYTKVINEESRTFTVPGVEDQVVYDWEHMRNDKYPSGQYTQQEADAVAKLIADCSVMSVTKFGPSGSGAALSNLRNGMIKYMGYDPSMKRINRVDYSAEEWGAILRNEIDENRPIVSEGYNPENTSSGHAFVLDGYDTEGAFHINWGWTGSYSGNTTFFAVDAFSPGSRNYNHNQHALIYMMPATGEMTVKLTDYGIVFSYDYYAPPENRNFYVNAKFYNYGTRPSGTWFKVFHADYRNNPISELTSTIWPGSTAHIAPNSESEKTNWYCKSVYDYKVGDKVMIFYSIDQGTLWYPLLATEGPKVPYCIPIYDIPFIDINEECTYEAGEPLNLLITNNRKAPSSIEWTFDGETVYPDKNGDYRINCLTTGNHTIRAVVIIDGEGTTLVQEITVK
ncbi:MAG: C10 family peptidase, partial [Bacteroidales bacterium]|nr:C10 family peptidase [Bacteroidales bacterium]